METLAQLFANVYKSFLTDHGPKTVHNAKMLLSELKLGTWLRLKSFVTQLNILKGHCR